MNNGTKSILTSATCRLSRFFRVRRVVPVAVVVGLSGLVGCSGAASEGESDLRVPAPVDVTEPTPVATVPAPPGGGPQTPSCGIFQVSRTEVVAGQTFAAGDYKVNTFGISCEEVMGDSGLFSAFLRLDDGASLPSPWRFLEGAVGAPKFVAGPGVGFRVQRVSD